MIECDFLEGISCYKFYAYLESLVSKMVERVDSSEIAGFAERINRSVRRHLFFEECDSRTPKDPVNLFVLNTGFKGGA